MNTLEDLCDRSALLGEFTINRRVTVLDAMTHVHKFIVIAHASNLRVSLPSTYIDYFFQLVVGAQRNVKVKKMGTPTTELIRLDVR